MPDDTSIQEWWAAGVERRQPLHIDRGHYKCLQPLSFDLNGCRQVGITVTGDGQGMSCFELASVSGGVPFRILCSHAADDDPKAEVSAFAADFSGFSVITRFDGPGAQLGRDDFLDALNSCYLQKFKIDNSCDSENVEALRVNHVLQTQFDVRANCHSRKNKNNLGTALHLRQSKFNKFQGGFSNAHIGILLSGGASSSNVFDCIDFEEGNVAIVVDSPDARNNLWLSPQLAYRHGLDFRDGVNNIIDSPNDGLRMERYNADGAVAGRKKGYLILNDKGLIMRNLLGDSNRVPKGLLERCARSQADD